MKKAIIYVFSGTGNTKLVAELYKKYLTEYETTIYQIRMQNGEYLPYPEPDDFDLVGFGYPVHGFNAPKVMFDFCKKLCSLSKQRPNQKTAFILKTSGEGLSVNNYSSQKIIRLLERYGYHFVQERHYVMPYNMIFRHTPEMVKSEYIYADAYARLSCKQLQAGETEKVRRCLLKAWFVPIVRIEWIYAQVQGPAMKVDMKKCIKCQKCVKNCPLENITFDGKKFKFGTHCALCVCCSFGCPTSAISIGILNGWKVNGDYKIEKTAHDSAIAFPAFGKNLKGLKKILYYKYYRNLEKQLEAGGVEVNLNDLKPDAL